MAVSDQDVKVVEEWVIKIWQNYVTAVIDASKRGANQDELPQLKLMRDNVVEARTALGEVRKLAEQN